MMTMVDRRRKKGLNVWFVVVSVCFMTSMGWFVVVGGDVSAHESLCVSLSRPRMTNVVN